MKEISFRQAQPCDHEVVVNLMRELIDELDPIEDASGIKIRLSDDIQKALNSEDICIFLATLEDSVIGFSRSDILFEDPIFRLRADNRCGYVDQMFVNPNYRGKKIGEKHNSLTIGMVETHKERALEILNRSPRKHFLY